MANVSIAFVVPTSNTTSAAVSVATMGPDKELIIGGGEFEANVSLEISPDGVRWSTVWTATQAGRYPLSFAAVSARIKVSGYKSGTPLADMNAEIGVATGLVLNVPAGDGTGTALDVSALTDFKTIVVAGAFTGQVLVEVSGDGVTYAPLPITFTAPDNFTITSPCTWMRLVRSGVSGGSAPTAGVASSQTTPSSSAAGGGSFVPLGSELVTSSIPTDPPTNIQSRMGYGVLVNPASPDAADDLDVTTPFITIQGAVDAIENVGQANLTTALTRAICFVAPGCYDEDVIIPPTVICIDMVMMGGVTLGAGRQNAQGGSTTPRSLTWQIATTSAMNNVQPRLSISTMTPELNGLYNGADSGTIAGAASAMNGLRISGSLEVVDGEGLADYDGFAYLYLSHVVIESNLTGATLADASAVLFLDNVRVGLLTSFPDNVNLSGNGFLWQARNCYFGYNLPFGTPAAGEFDVDTVRFMENCFFNGDFTVDSFSNSGTSTNNNPNGLHNCTFVQGTITAPDGVVCDVETALSIAALGAASYDLATNGPIKVFGTPSSQTFGNTDIAAAAGDVFLTPGFESAAAGAADDKQLPVLQSNGGGRGIVLGVGVRHNLSAGNGADVTYELLVNGAPLTPAMTVVLTTGAIGQAFTAASLQAFFTSGARFSLKATKPGGGIADGVQNVTAVVNYLAGSA